jgi:hypothetical protein
VALRGNSRQGPFGTFCAGGDLRFFYEQTLQENPQVGDFFTEEYALDALIHAYPKPVIACMDGIVMGGGMGLAQGASHRIVTERSQLAMPETRIGFFPDVGGGHFLRFHLVKLYLNSPLGQLPGAFAAGKARADDCYVHAQNPLSPGRNGVIPPLFRPFSLSF